MNRRSITHALSLIASVLALSGCETFSGAIQAREGPYGQPIPAAPPKRNAVEERAKLVLTASNAGLKEAMEYKDDFPGEAIDDIKVTQTADGATKVLFVANSGKGFFPAGEYSLVRTKTGERKGIAFVDLTANAIASVLEEVKKVGVASVVVISIDYAAQADGIPIRSLRYRGDLGKVELDAESTTVNGKPQSISVNPGQLVNNEQLAALRAVSMRKLVKNKLKGLNLAERFELTTTDESGPSHRWVKVTLSILPAN